MKRAATVGGVGRGVGGLSNSLKDASVFSLNRGHPSDAQTKQLPFLSFSIKK